ncbi:hypothetical protein MLD38_021014 [Melastoma candidum]|uniref:Uncharacterized protein n=1 Tax=Melastoma candidum TaxID=119954 RepID=A0ACB9QI61_9MYRT|nr:hypothetical protein MLD38_021014 [Melastoma candidum]
MASSHVEIASPSPFHCVLKDHSRRRDRHPDPNKAAMTPQDTFHNKLLKNLVRDHLPAFPAEVGKVKDGRIDPWFIKEPRNEPRGDAFEREGECSALSLTQARIVDRWAAQQARGMVSTIEKHAQVADLLYESDSRKPVTSTSLGDTSPTESLDNANKGAFSLVQMWEARLSRPNGNTTNSIGCCSRSNSSALSCPENVMNSPREDTLSYFEGAHQTNEDLLVDWESDGAGTGKDPSPSFKGRASSASDSERGRVANIIRRLTSTGDANENDASPAAESPYRERERTHHHGHAIADQKLFLHAASSPRIRGRQAFSDLLMQMERDRHKELETLTDRCAVSKFSQRGRIQAHLKLKLLQHGLAARERHPLNLFRGPSRGSAPNNPSIPPLREMIKTTAELDLKEHKGLVDLGASPRHIMSNVSQMATTSASDQPSDDFDDKVCRSLQPDSEVMAPPSMESTTSKYDDDSVARVSDSTVEILSYEDPSLECQQSMDACSSLVLWYEDEQEADEELPTMESNYDWISKISRPRSYWEDRRQSWYREMLEQDSANEDILHLLRRRRVSTFLCSDFRERMDDLMVSHFHKQNDLLALPEDAQIHLDFPMLVSTLARDRSASHQQQSDVGEPVQDGERVQLQVEESGAWDIGEVIDRDSNEAGQELSAEEAAVEELVVEEDERSMIREQYHEASDHSRHSPLSSRSSSSFESLTRSWGFEAHDQAACLSSAQSPRSRAYYMDPLQHTRSIDPLSLEIELINELRGQMKQLRREMSELRRSIKTCIDFQATMQFTMKQEISSSERGDGMSMKQMLRRSSCCICYDKPIDSLLYRCGHMCMCLECAVKLQFGSGKCPTCRAPIEDVVRAYPDSRE